MEESFSPSVIGVFNPGTRETKHDIVHCTRWKSTLFIHFLVSEKWETGREEIPGRRDVELGQQRDSPVLTHQWERKKKKKA